MIRRFGFLHIAIFLVVAGLLSLLVMARRLGIAGLRSMCLVGHRNEDQE